jgi:hypothetical protein
VQGGIFRMPACLPVAVRLTPLGRRKGRHSNIECHHGEGASSSSPRWHLSNSDAISM